MRRGSTARRSRPAGCEWTATTDIVVPRPASAGVDGAARSTASWGTLRMQLRRPQVRPAIVAAPPSISRRSGGDEGFARRQLVWGGNGHRRRSFVSAAAVPDFEGSPRRPQDTAPDGIYMDGARLAPRGLRHLAGAGVVGREPPTTRCLAPPREGGATVAAKRTNASRSRPVGGGSSGRRPLQRHVAHRAARERDRCSRPSRCTAGTRRAGSRPALREFDVSDA